MFLRTGWEALRDEPEEIVLRSQKQSLKTEVLARFKTAVIYRREFFPFSTGQDGNPQSLEEYKHVVTMLLLVGWIHAVFTPDDSLVLGGNFVHSFNIPGQIKISKIEENTKVNNLLICNFLSNIFVNTLYQCENRLGNWGEQR